MKLGDIFKSIVQFFRDELEAISKTKTGDRDKSKLKEKTNEWAQKGKEQLLRALSFMPDTLLDIDDLTFHPLSYRRRHDYNY